MKKKVISFGYQKGIREEFEWVGTRDYSAWPATETALQWYNDLGAENIMKYQKDLCRYGSSFLSGLWDSESFVQDDTLISNSMFNIRLPSEAMSLNMTLSEINNPLRSRNIFGAFFVYDGDLYARLSCQIYNEEKDFERLGNAVLEAIVNKRNRP